MNVKGIAKPLVNALVDRTLHLSQGRNAGCIGFLDEEGIVATHTEIVDGGLSGIPLRILLNKMTSMDGKSLIEGLSALSERSVIIMTRPGKTGLITDVSGVDFFNMPIINIGVKNDGLAGIGLITPKEEHFDLATESEQINLATLGSLTMEDEKDVLRQGNLLSLKYLDVSRELEAVEKEARLVVNPKSMVRLSYPRLSIDVLDKTLAEHLVSKSKEVGQGREVATIAVVEDGKVSSAGRIVKGGMGYVPSRLLASSAVDISAKSLMQIYSELIPENGVIVHTHPGGTGVMHIGDANAGPGTWGRAIIAIGHDAAGEIRGATAIEVSDKIYQLADEDERLNQEFFNAETPEMESTIRNRKFGVAQEYTDLCKPIQIQ